MFTVQNCYGGTSLLPFPYNTVTADISGNIYIELSKMFPKVEIQKLAYY